MRIFNGRGVFNCIRQYAVLFMLIALFGVTIFAQTNKVVNSDNKSLGVNHSTSSHSADLLKNRFNYIGQKQENKKVLEDFCIPLPHGGLICF